MELIKIEMFENTIRYELDVRVLREQRNTLGLVDLMVECRKGTMPFGGVLHYPSDLGVFWVCQTGGNVWESSFGTFRIVDETN